MKLRERWDTVLAAEGRQRLNLYDPACFTDEEQIEMFGSIQIGKGKKKSLLKSSSRTAKEEKVKKKKKQLLDTLSSLSEEELNEIIKNFPL